jgi:hypothetical protein
MIIKIDDGDTFEGSFEQFQDCFFTFSSEGMAGRKWEIEDFCRREGSKVQFIEEGKTFMNVIFLRNPIQYIKQKRSIRRQRRMAVKLMAASGTLRSADHGIRYGLAGKELEKFLTEPEP